MPHYIRYSNSNFNRQLLAFDIGDTILVSFLRVGKEENQVFKAILFQHLNDEIMVDRVEGGESVFYKINETALHVNEVCHTRAVLTEKFRWRKYFRERSFMKGGFEEYEKLRTEFVKNFKTE